MIFCTVTSPEPDPSVANCGAIDPEFNASASRNFQSESLLGGQFLQTILRILIVGIVGRGIDVQAKLAVRTQIGMNMGEV